MVVLWGGGGGGGEGDAPRGKLDCVGKRESGTKINEIVVSVTDFSQCRVGVGYIL